MSLAPAQASVAYTRPCHRRSGGDSGAHVSHAARGGRSAYVFGSDLITSDDPASKAVSATMGSDVGLSEPLLPGPPGDADEGDVEASAGRPAAPHDSRPAAAVTAAAASADSLGPLGSANPLSAATFSWVSPLLKRGSTQEQLHQRDLFALPPHLLPAACGQRLLGKWRQVGRNWGRL